MAKRRYSLVPAAHHDPVPRPNPIGYDHSSTFVLYPEKRLVVLTLGSRVTIDDLVEYARLLRKDLSFDPTFSEIADMRAVEEVALQAEEMVKVADQVDPFSPEAKRAFVVRSSTSAHAARMHKALLSHRNFKVFHSLEEAERWMTADPTTRIS